MADRVIIFQVAEEAGASAKTVSTVIHGKPGASEEIRRHVQEAAERLEYRASRPRDPRSPVRRRLPASPLK